MIKRTAKNITCLGWAAAIFVLLVLLAIPLLPRAFGQPRNRGAKESLPHAVSEASRSQPLPYDVRPNPPGSPRPRGFYNVSGVLPRAGMTGVSQVSTAPPLHPSGLCPPTITQSTRQAIVEFNSAACTDPGIGT